LERGRNWGGERGRDRVVSSIKMLDPPQKRIGQNKKGEEGNGNMRRNVAQRTPLQRWLKKKKRDLGRVLVSVKTTLEEEKTREKVFKVQDHDQH